MRGILTGLVLALGVGGPAQAVNVNWVDWVSRSGTTVTGTLDIGGTDVGVTFTTTAPSIFGAQTAGGTDYWISLPSGRNPAVSPYTSTGPTGNSNIPTGTDIVQLSAAGVHTLTFDQAISDIYMSFVSINGNTYDFGGTAIELLSATGLNIDGSGVDERGYWGSGTPTISGPSPWTMFGNGEAHGTLMLAGDFPSLSWSTTAEAWHGFTIGVEGIALPPPPAVPLPAAGWLALAGLGALGGLRGARRV
jgi:hypothetical protein